MTANFLQHYQMLNSEQENYFQAGNLEEIFSLVLTANRLFYAEFEVTIPSGGTVEIVTQANKEASYNYYYKGSDITTNGFDMVTQLGSNLYFKKQSASIETHDIMNIIGQNFGFDVENGVTTVELDLEEAYYYLHVDLIELEEDNM